MRKIISFFLLVLFVQPAFANKVESVFSFTKNFDYKSCKMPVRNKTELPKVFVTVLGYSGAKELPSERVVSNYREYFMSLSSNARISEKYARLTRDEIVKISKQKKLQWDNNWKKNQYGNFFFTASIAIPVAIEVLYQKNNFSKQEFNLVVEYLDFLNNQMLQTAPTKNEWWSPNNLSFDYAVFAYTLGLIKNKQSHKDKAIKILKWGLSELRKDGSIPGDAKRIGSALHYTNKAVVGLVTLAELAAVDNHNLYDVKYKSFFSSVEKDIELAMDFLISATENPNLIYPYALEGQKQGSTGYKQYSPSNQDKRFINNQLITWGYYYIRRFPDSELSKRLLKLSPFLKYKRVGFGETAGANPLCFITGK